MKKNQSCTGNHLTLRPSTLLHFPKNFKITMTSSGREKSNL